MVRREFFVGRFSSFLYYHRYPKIEITVRNYLFKEYPIKEMTE